MNGSDDYTTGPHDPRVHFWCGLVFGAVVGTWIGWNIFTGDLGMAAMGAAGACAMAFSCRRWGDRAWHWVLRRLDWFS
jgi:hypothetical protein